MMDTQSIRPKPICKAVPKGLQFHFITLVSERQGYCLWQRYFGMISMIMTKRWSVVVFSKDAVCEHVAGLNKRTGLRVAEFGMNSYARIKKRSMKSSIIEVCDSCAQFFANAFS